MPRADLPSTCLAALAAALCGCGPTPGPADGGSDTFVPFASHFAGYTAWQSFEVLGGPAHGLSHLAGDRVIYLNRRPQSGASTFPVGTLIVKAVPAMAQIFAMAKRGANYNSDGAANWEWLELEGTPEQPFIRWRGIGPPDGEGYGAPGESGCNTCHFGAMANDFVQAGPLQLSGF